MNFGAWAKRFDTLLVFSAPGGSVHPVESVEVDSEHFVEQVGVGSEALEVSAFSSRYSHSTLPQAWVSLSQLELVPKWWQFHTFSVDSLGGNWCRRPAASSAPSVCSQNWGIGSCRNAG